MKKTLFFGMTAATMMLAACGTNNQLGQVGSAVLGQVLNQTMGTAGTATTDALGNVIQSVLGGTSKPTKQNIIGTWNYSQPGCAFTSDKLLAQAGGELVASEIKSKLQPTYQTLGINSSNTQVVFKEDGTFSAKIAGKSWSGTYTFNESTSQINMKGLLLNMNCYAKKNATGIGLLFESSKLLTLLQTMAALSGNSSLQTVGELSKTYDGLRLGFDFK